MKLYQETYKLRCKELKKQGLALEELNNFRNFEDILSQPEFKLCMNKKHNRANKRYRTREKLLTLYRIYVVVKQKNPSAKVLFGTITLNNNNLKLKEDTYIRKIDSWLKEHFIYSILNKDFGTETEREHYHFIGLTTEEIEDTGKKSYKGYKIFELVNKTYGAGFEPDLELIDDRFDDISKTVNYLLKLNNHSNKTSTKDRVRVIKNHQADMVILLNNLEYKKTRNKAKKKFYERMKALPNFPTYDELNKMSSSDKEISLNSFVEFLDGKKSISEL